MAGGRIDGQPAVALDVERCDGHTGLHAGGGVDGDDAVARAVVLGEEDAVGGGVEGGAGEVVVGIQREAGEHRASGGVDRQHAVRVGVAVEDQQAARGYRGGPQGHGSGEHLQAEVVEAVRRPEISRQRDGLQHLSGGRVDLEQIARVGLIAHPQLARGVHRHVAQVGARHAHAHGVQCEGCAGAAGGADADIAQPVRGQRGAVEVDAAVLEGEVGAVVGVDVVGVGWGVAHGGPGEAVGARAFDEARAEQHGAVLDVDAGEGGHDLQQRLGGRAEQLQREGAIGVRGHEQRGAGAVGGDRARAQAHHLQGAVGVRPAHQDVAAQVQPRAHQRDRLAGVGRGLGGVCRRAAEGHAGDAGDAGGVARAHATGGLDADRTEHPVYCPAVQRHGQIHVAVGHIAQRRIRASEDVCARASAGIEHHARAEAVLAVVALDEARARNAHRGCGAVGGHAQDLHISDRGHDLQREGAIGEIGAHRADLRVDDRVARHGINGHREESEIERRVHTNRREHTCRGGAVRIGDVRLHPRCRRIERHRDADLLCWVGRRCRRDVGDAEGRAHVTGRPDREVANDRRGQRVARSVADHARSDGQSVIPCRQDRVDQDAQLLATGAGVKVNGGADVIGGAEDAVGTRPNDPHAAGVQTGRVKRFIEGDVDRTHQETP